MEFPPLTPEQRAKIAVQEMRKRPMEIVGQAFFLQLFDQAINKNLMASPIKVQIGLVHGRENYTAHADIKFIKQ